MTQAGKDLYSTAKIADLELRNRIIKAGCFEGMSQGGGVTDALLEHHRRMAEGGIAMTTVAYCSVSYDGRAFGHEMWMRDELIPELKHLTDRIHNEGAAVSIQLGHCGYFASREVIGKRPLGASRKFNLFRTSFSREMTKDDIEEKTNDFISAVRLAKEAGFDAVEIHAGHGYLLSQFLSPYTNKRKDEYGGSLENRMRFPKEVMRRIREMAGPGFPILVKMNIRDGMKGGLELEESIKVAQMFEASGASAIIPSSGFTSKTPFMMLRGKLPVAEMTANQTKWYMKLGLTLFGKFMVQEYPYTSKFHLAEARQFVDAVKIPVIYVGGLTTKEDIKNTIDDGFKFVQLGRALIHDPDFLKHPDDPSKQDCDHCNRCVAAMDGGGVYCVSKEQGYL